MRYEPRILEVKLTDTEAGDANCGAPIAISRLKDVVVGIDAGDDSTLQVEARQHGDAPWIPIGSTVDSTKNTVAMPGAMQDVRIVTKQYGTGTVVPTTAPVAWVSGFAHDTQ